MRKVLKEGRKELSKM